MSEFSAVSLANPYGLEDNVLRLVIDTDAAYFMRNLVNTEGEYTFSIWARSDNATHAYIDLFGSTNQFDVTSKWQKFTITGTLDATGPNNYISLTADTNSTVYFYEALLVKGRNDTDWTPAPEDITDKLESISEEAQNTFENWSRYIHFSSDPTDSAISIGTSDSKITLHLDNEQGIVFKKNGEQFGYWDGVDFHTGNVVIAVNERAQFGKFAFIPRTNNGLQLLKVE